MSDIRAEWLATMQEDRFSSERPKNDPVHTHTKHVEETRAETHP